MHQRPIVLNHNTQYEENPLSHHGGMCEDGHAVGWTDLHRIFPDSAFAEQVNVLDL